MNKTKKKKHLLRKVFGPMALGLALFGSVISLASCNKATDEVTEPEATETVESVEGSIALATKEKANSATETEKASDDTTSEEESTEETKEEKNWFVKTWDEFVSLKTDHQVLFWIFVALAGVDVIGLIAVIIKKSRK